MEHLNPFYDNGNPRFKGEYSNGEMHGYWEFFRKDGTLMRSGTFNEGIQVGVWTTCDQQGHPYKETEFKN